MDGAAAGRSQTLRATNTPTTRSVPPGQSASHSQLFSWTFLPGNGWTGLPSPESRRGAHISNYKSAGGTGRFPQTNSGMSDNNTNTPSRHRPVAYRTTTTNQVNEWGRRFRRRDDVIVTASKSGAPDSAANKTIRLSRRPVSDVSFISFAAVRVGSTSLSLCPDATREGRRCRGRRGGLPTMIPPLP